MTFSREGYANTGLVAAQQKDQWSGNSSFFENGLGFVERFGE